MSASKMYITRCLLGAHGLFLCLCFLGMASAQPSADVQRTTSAGLEDLLAELSSGSTTGGNAFKLFVQRAQLVVTGLMHVSILLLPRLTDAARQDTAGKAKRQPGNSTKPSGGSKLGAASSSTGKVASNNLPAPGFPADGSNLATWSGVNEALAKQAASGLDWGNSCVYTLSRDKGPRVAPQPGYPLTATAAFHAAVAPGGKKEAIICNDYDQKGLHYADWADLRSSGARSMAATPMYSGSNELMGVLTLASSEPHAFDKSRVVWVLAMALAPLAATLRYAVHAMHVEDFIARAMPALLEQNYVRTANRGKKIGKERTAKPTANGAAAKKGQGEGKVHHPPSSSSMEESSSSPSSTVGHPNGSMASTPTKGASELSGSALGTSTALPPESANGAVDASVSPSAGSEQFAEHAEVLITGSGSSSRSASATLASLSPKAPPMQSGLDVDGAGPGAKQSGDAVTTGPKLPRSAPASISSATPTKNHATNGTVAPANGTPSPGTTVVPSTGTAGEDSYISPHPGSDADLDWGDFFFNLVSMCIVYAYFSDAAVGGENRAAVGVSMAIAAVDILLLALRWLWYEHRISYGGAVLQVFHVYRLVVLPIANTWMSWSLLNKLGVKPGGTAVVIMGALFMCLFLAGLRMRALLHAPLQLASVLFAAASTTQLCTQAFGEPKGLRCMGAVSLLQLLLGVLLPSLAAHLVDLKASTGKHHLPHVQAKRGLLSAAA